MPWFLTRRIPDCLRIQHEDDNEVETNTHFGSCQPFASLSLGQCCISPTSSAKPHRPVAHFHLADSRAASSDWSVDQEGFSYEENFPTGFRGFIASCLAASIDNSASQVTQLTMGPSMVWRMPFLIAAAFACVRAYLTHPRTCVVCSKQWFWVDGPLSAARCWQCNRAFHHKCLERIGIEGPDPQDRYEPWYHSSPCQQVSWHLYETMKRGPYRLPQSNAYTCQLSINTRLADPTLPSGSGLDAWEFFNQHFADFKLPHDEPLLYAVLRHRGRLVSAAVLEVFGQDLAHLKFVVTDTRLRHQGHYRALQRALEQWLTQAGVRQLMVTSRPESMELWPRMGFKLQPDETQVDELEREFGTDLVMGEGNLVFVKELGNGDAESGQGLGAAPGHWSGIVAPLRVELAQGRDEE